MGLGLLQDKKSKSKCQVLNKYKLDEINTGLSLEMPQEPCIMSMDGLIGPVFFEDTTVKGTWIISSGLWPAHSRNLNP
jgi:hypothetical protein